MKRKKLTELKKRLFEVGITQRDLAREVGIPENKVSMLVNGHYIPSEDQIRRICDILGRKPEQLFVE